MSYLSVMIEHEITKKYVYLYCIDPYIDYTTNIKPPLLDKDYCHMVEDVETNQ